MNAEETPQKKEKQEKIRFYETWTFLILFCICVPILIRSLVYTPFHIPSGSMKPNLLIGDYIFVSKFSYGYSKYSFPLAPDIFDGRIFGKEPKRGDIIVFRLPTNPDIDYIKRLIGMPGDTVQVKGGKLFLNGKKVKSERTRDFKTKDERGRKRTIERYIETLPNGISYETLDANKRGGLDNTPPYKVPQGHYFFMGDNRDNSQDSRVQRVVGFVPYENLIGRADLVFISTEGKLWKIWEWFTTLRVGRSFTPLS